IWSLFFVYHMASSCTWTVLSTTHFFFVGGYELGGHCNCGIAVSLNALHHGNLLSFCIVVLQFIELYKNVMDWDDSGALENFESV
ncbi:hypothetical protein ACJX0J_018939, partial [Zea mays]